MYAISYNIVLVLLVHRFKCLSMRSVLRALFWPFYTVTTIVDYIDMKLSGMK